MKAIQPIPIWQNGQIIQATTLNAYVIQDNLKTQATFYYNLMDANGSGLANGNLTMEGSDYDDYSSNQQAWSWVGSKLGLTIIGDTNKPQVTPTEIVSPEISS